jgi:hypothetical protein
MEFGEERGWWERTGDRIYEKEEWKKIPTERFQNYATQTLNMVAADMPQDQSDWLYGNLSNIPSYEVYNPFAVVLGFLVLDWDTKKVGEKRFQSMVAKYAAKLQMTPADILRYGRKWEMEWLHELM